MLNDGRVNIAQLADATFHCRRQIFCSLHLRLRSAITFSQRFDGNI